MVCLENGPDDASWQNRKAEAELSQETPLMGFDAGLELRAAGCKVYAHNRYTVLLTTYMEVLFKALLH